MVVTVQVLVVVAVTVVVVVSGGLAKTTNKLAEISTPTMTIAEAMAR